MAQITKDTIIGDILDIAPETAPIFLSIGMHCLGCPSSRGETVEQACMVHGVEVEELLAKSANATLPASRDVGPKRIAGGLLAISVGATVLAALGIYATFPVLKNTFTGLLGVDAQYKEAAQGCGMSPAQQLLRVELPLAMPTIIGGLRMSMVYTVSWAVLAAMIGLGGLGTFIYQGVQSSNNALILLGAVPAALLAFLLGGLIDLLQKHVVPKGLRKGGR